MPLFFRYNAGNIVDVTTLRATIAELEAFGVNTDYAIVDAGYCSDNNIQCLYGSSGEDKPIPFLTRLKANLKLYKELAACHAEDLTKSKYMIIQRDRLLSVKRVEVNLFGHSAFAYIAIDHARRDDEVYKYLKSAIENKETSPEEMDIVTKTKGMFILISSEEIELGDIMPLYYTRQAIEQVFDVSKNNVHLLPLRVHNEETFRGHLMLSFIASTAYLFVNQMLNGSSFHADAAFAILRNQKCKVFDDCILPKEINKKMNDIYKILKIKLPLRIPF
jgi:transposase